MGMLGSAAVYTLQQKPSARAAEVFFALSHTPSHSCPKMSEQQQQRFVEALGAKLASSFQAPEGGIAAPRQTRARFTAVARAAIERLPTDLPLRKNLLEEFGAISGALWEQYASAHPTAADAAAASTGGDKPCLLAAGGVELALAAGSADGATLEELVRLPWLSAPHRSAAAATLRTAITSELVAESEALRLASLASCGENGSPSPVALAALAAVLGKLASIKKAQSRHVAAARAVFHRLAQRPLLAAGASVDTPATLRSACVSYLEMCSVHGGPGPTERRPDEPAARCAARHVGLMLGRGQPTVAAEAPSASLEQLSALLYSLFTSPEMGSAPAGSFSRVAMDTLVSFLPLEIPQAWRPTPPANSYLQLLVVLRLAAQEPSQSPSSGKPVKGRKVARKLCKAVVQTLKPKMEVATVPRAVAVAARAETGSEPGGELAWWPVDRLRLLLAVRRYHTRPQPACLRLAICLCE